MEGVGKTELIVDARVLLSADHERDHPGHVGLIGKHLQIHHQFAMLRKLDGNASRTLEVGHLAG